MPPALILASGSPRRRELLEKIGVTFEIVTAEVEELMNSATLTPREIAQHNAEAKARAVMISQPGRWILGADTIVVLGGRLLGKPPTPEAARDYLAPLSGHTHEVITGCCLHQRGGTMETFSDTFARDLPRNSRRKRSSNISPHVHVLDKAGAYALQEHGDWLVECVEGSRDNVLGLPTEVLRGVLARHGLL